MNRLPLAIALTLSTSAFAQTSEIPQSIQDKARSIIAARTGASASEIEILSAVAVAYPGQGLTTYQFKGSSPQGETAGVALDPNAVEVDALKLNEQEDTRYVERNGRISTGLLEDLAKLPPDQELKVAIWAREPSTMGEGLVRPEANKDLQPADVDSVYQQQQSWRREVVSAATKPLLERFAAMGYQATADEEAPVVEVTLKPDTIREIARWDDITEVDAARFAEPTMDVARATIESDLVQNAGITGSGVRVGVIEVGGRAHTTNPYMPPITQDLTGSCLHWHGTSVVGVIASRHTTHKGIAPNSSIYLGGDCFGSTSGLTAASNRASNWGARVFNLSFGSTAGTQPGTMDRYYDDLVQNRWRTVVASAGNSGWNVRVASPARGYNLISVGSFKDQNTVLWSGDVMSSFSSGLDPASTYGDREKPELAAPGENITTLNGASPWLHTTSGTSFSAPAVTGVTAQLMQRRTALQVWPESVKAILMATAVHNVEGATRLSELEGAGSVVTTQADDVARGVDGNWGGISYSCASPTWTTVATMPLWANRPARVVITWDTNTSYASYANRPSADLDLQVLSPTGGVVASSASFDNTYEIGEFTPSVAGNYTVRVRKWSCALTPKWLGWAWYQNR
ncbi:S8 family peptidase [Archangium lansingense]|uniref:S8 family serine peptidase n=1 Tax=Archangium lansingense TaxID=2995310 RepID=A0ABT4AK79_9BACT|nr:S8 family serine peptidase [Archangium lansinium]MCY1082094.1 S8 family serine peptidase [Archangium lansinium]